MRRLNIDLERAVAAIQDADNMIPIKFSKMSSAIQHSTEIKQNQSQVASADSEDISRLSIDLDAYSLGFGDSLLESNPGSRLLQQKMKKGSPPPLPQRSNRNKNISTSSSANLSANFKTQHWPPKMSTSVIVPSPDHQKTKDPVFAKLSVKKTVQMRKNFSETCCEILSWSETDGIPLPPPEPRKVPTSPADQAAAALEEVRHMALEDWRSHLVSLELAENELLKDIDKYERKNKELTAALKRAAKKNKHRTANNGRVGRFRSKEPNRLVDSFRFSVRSQTKAALSIHKT